MAGAIPSQQYDITDISRDEISSRWRCAANGIVRMSAAKRHNNTALARVGAVVGMRDRSRRICPQKIPSIKLPSVQRRMPSF
jgi:hypothetical protein